MIPSEERPTSLQWIGLSPGVKALFIFISVAGKTDKEVVWKTSQIKDRCWGQIGCFFITLHMHSFCAILRHDEAFNSYVYVAAHAQFEIGGASVGAVT